MKKTTRLTAICLIASVATTSPSWSADGETATVQSPPRVAAAIRDPTLAGLPSEMQAWIESRVAERMRQTRTPGLTIAVARDNQLCYAAGFGFANVEHRVRATPRTRFRTASIAKSMTAVAALSLAGEGKLNLDDDVRTYVPDFPKKQWPVTSRQLLGHLGGVRHYKSFRETIATDHHFDLTSALGTFKDDPLVHAPESKYLYTTFGFNLLGNVIEGASQESFLDALKRRVFEPAEMRQTRSDDVFAVIPDRAAGYVRPTSTQISQLRAADFLQSGKLYNASLHDTSMKIPGGGLVSTASDLIRFATALNDGRMLTEPLRQAMWTAQSTADGTPTGYGLGWRVGQHRGIKTVWHTGGQAGVSTVLLLRPGTGPGKAVAVAIMCNLQNTRLLSLAQIVADQVEPPPVFNGDYADAIEKLRSAVQFEVEQKQLPAFSIALIDGQRTVWADGFGHVDAKKKQRATKDTVYRVGSVSKLFTDIAVMRLVEEGKLKLSDRVDQLLPSFEPQNPFRKPITLRQLMTHRSGLVRESPVGNYFDPSEPTLADTVASLNQTKLVYAPGSKTKYSNAAVSVVGAILEEKIDVTHSEHVFKTILKPLGMDHSSFDRETDTKNHAVGWMRTYDGRRFEAPVFQLGTGPAGNLYSSADDLGKFLRCLFREGTHESGSLVSPKTLRQMWTPFRDRQGRPQRFGIGFHVESLDGHVKVGHGGAIYGFSTQLEALPDRKIGVAAVTSLDGANGVVSRLADYALRLMLAAQDNKPLPSYATTAPVPRKRADELTGRYRDPDGGFARISRYEDQVFLHRGSFRYELRASAKSGDIVIDDAVGYGSQVRRRQSGDVQIGSDTLQRIKEDRPPAAAPEKWSGLIGEYGWDHNTLYILERDGQLYALIEWFYYYPLKQVDADTFQFPNYGLYHGEGLKFHRDAKGRATHVVAAEVKFDRRELGVKDGKTFQITPVRPIDELRGEALDATPPKERGEFRKPQLAELTKLEPGIHLDIRYATTNNFTGAVFYKQPRAFMQQPAAEAVARAHKQLAQHGLGLLIHDAYRPWHVTKMFWDATPSNLKDFVANPRSGSRHNRGCAVDLTLYDLGTGDPIPMVAGYDEFSPRSFPLYPGGTSRQRWHRRLLRQVMESQGFSIYEYEWWHFDFKDWKKYRIGNATFEAILER